MMNVVSCEPIVSIPFFFFSIQNLIPYRCILASNESFNLQSMIKPIYPTRDLVSYYVMNTLRASIYTQSHIYFLFCCSMSCLTHIQMRVHF